MIKSTLKLTVFIIILKITPLGLRTLAQAETLTHSACMVKFRGTVSLN